MPRSTRSPLRELRAWGALLLVLSLALPAQGLAGPVEDRAAARTEFAHAQEDYAAARYEEARAGYTRAYALMPSPAFLFNIAQCHRQLGQWAEAETFYRRYLEGNPKASNRTLVEGFIADMQKAQEDEARMMTARAPALPTPAADPASASEPAPFLTPPAPTPVASAPRPLHQQWWFWAGVGVLAAGAATATAVAAQPHLAPTTLGDIVIK